MTDDEYYDDPELGDLRAEALARKRYHNVFMRHPDCRDPDHPGCKNCEDFDDDEWMG